MLHLRYINQHVMITFSICLLLFYSRLLYLRDLLKDYLNLTTDKHLPLL